MHTVFFTQSLEECIYKSIHGHDVLLLVAFDGRRPSTNRNSIVQLRLLLVLSKLFGRTFARGAKFHLWNLRSCEWMFLVMCTVATIPSRRYRCLVGNSTVNNSCSYLCYFVYAYNFRSRLRSKCWWWNWGVVGRLGSGVRVKTSTVTDTETVLTLP